MFPQLSSFLTHIANEIVFSFKGVVFGYPIDEHGDQILTHHAHQIKQKHKNPFAIFQPLQTDFMCLFYEGMSIQNSVSTNEQLKLWNDEQSYLSYNGIHSPPQSDQILQNSHRNQLPLRWLYYYNSDSAHMLNQTAFSHQTLPYVPQYGSLLIISRKPPNIIDTNDITAVQPQIMYYIPYYSGVENLFHYNTTTLQLIPAFLPSPPPPQLKHILFPHFLPTDSHKTHVIAPSLQFKHMPDQFLSSTQFEGHYDTVARFYDRCDEIRLIEEYINTSYTYIEPLSSKKSQYHPIPPINDWQMDHFLYNDMSMINYLKLVHIHYLRQTSPKSIETPQNAADPSTLPQNSSNHITNPELLVSILHNNVKIFNDIEYLFHWHYFIVKFLSFLWNSVLSFLFLIHDMDATPYGDDYYSDTKLISDHFWNLYRSLEEKSKLEKYEKMGEKYIEYEFLYQTVPAIILARSPRLSNIALVQKQPSLTCKYQNCQKNQDPRINDKNHTNNHALNITDEILSKNAKNINDHVHFELKHIKYTPGPRDIAYPHKNKRLHIKLAQQTFVLQQICVHCMLRLYYGINQGYPCNHISRLVRDTSISYAKQQFSKTEIRGNYEKLHANDHNMRKQNNNENIQVITANSLNDPDNYKIYPTPPILRSLPSRTSQFSGLQPNTHGFDIINTFLRNPMKTHQNTPKIHHEIQHFFDDDGIIRTDNNNGTVDENSDCLIDFIDFSVDFHQKDPIYADYYSKHDKSNDFLLMNQYESQQNRENDLNTPENTGFYDNYGIFHQFTSLREKLVYNIQYLTYTNAVIDGLNVLPIIRRSANSSIQQSYTQDFYSLNHTNVQKPRGFSEHDDYEFLCHLYENSLFYCNLQQNTSIGIDDSDLNDIYGGFPQYNHVTPQYHYYEDYWALKYAHEFNNLLKCRKQSLNSSENHQKFKKIHKNYQKSEICHKRHKTGPEFAKYDENINFDLIIDDYDEYHEDLTLEELYDLKYYDTPLISIIEFWAYYDDNFGDIEDIELELCPFHAVNHQYSSNRPNNQEKTETSPESSQNDQNHQKIIKKMSLAFETNSFCEFAKLSLCLVGRHQVCTCHCKLVKISEQLCENTTYHYNEHDKKSTDNQRYLTTLHQSSIYLQNPFINDDNSKKYSKNAENIDDPQTSSNFLVFSAATTTQSPTQTSLCTRILRRICRIIHNINNFNGFDLGGINEFSTKKIICHTSKNFEINNSSRSYSYTLS